MQRWDVVTEQSENAPALRYIQILKDLKRQIWVLLLTELAVIFIVSLHLIVYEIMTPDFIHLPKKLTVGYLLINKPSSLR